MRLFFKACLCLLIPASAQAADLPVADFNGAWQNDMGSQVQFIVKEGVVNGLYNTNVGAPDKAQSFPLVGQVNGDQIVFTVNFKAHGSMSAWVGQITKNAKGETYLRTLWHNTKNIEDAKEKDDIWGSIRTGASQFTRVKTP